MSLLFDSTIKVSLVFLLAIGAAELLNRRSAAVRHWTLAVAVGCATLVPLLGLVLPAWEVPLALFAPTAEEIRTPVVSATVVLPEEEARPALPASEVRRATAVAQPKPVAWLSWVPLIWGAGVGVSLFLLLIGLARLGWLASSAERVDRGPWVDIAD